MSYIQIDFYESQWATYTGNNKYTGSNDGLIQLLKHARSKVGPADGNTFVAMANFLKEKNYKGLRILYKVTETPTENIEFGDKQKIY